MARLIGKASFFKNADVPVGPERRQNQMRPARQISVVGFVKDPSGIAALYLCKCEGKNFATGVKSVWADRARSQAGLENNSTLLSVQIRVDKTNPQTQGNLGEPSFTAEVQFRD
jgi:bifunctional non-homologous end joining protein LigD